jgi:putative transposase
MRPSAANASVGWSASAAHRCTYAPKGSALSTSTGCGFDAQYLNTPCYGARQKARHLRRGGDGVSRKRMSRLMAKLGLVAVYPRPKTAKSHSPHRRYPYLAAGFSTCGDHGRVFAPRAVFPAVEHGFRPTCVAALPAAIERFGVPEIFNTDQGCQFTSDDFTGTLNEPGIRRSMAGFGRWMDNVFIPHRPHSSLKDRTPDEAFRDTTPLAQAA